MSEKNKGGRPSKYDKEYHPKVIQKYYALGLLDYQVAGVLDISIDTFYSWMGKYTACEQAKLDGNLVYQENKNKRKKFRSSEKQKEKQNNYQKKRLSDNIQFRLKNAFSSNIRGRLKTKKNIDYFISVGYTLQDLMIHLEKLFTKEMNWDNYGDVWHIDHKTPDSWFVYESQDCEGFKNSWSLDNLQPLLKAENLSKGNRFASI